MIENPQGTLSFLRILRTVVGCRGVSGINFNHETCEHTDLCASVLMDVMLMNARAHWKWSKQRVRIQGTLPPPSNPLHKLIVNSGIVAHVIGATNVPIELTEGVHKFRLIKGGKSSPIDSARKEIVSSGLAAYFVNCMRSVGFELKIPAQGLLSAMVSEVLDNAELHGSVDGRWYAIGYFNPNAENAIDGSCHIVLFNFGDSVHQSLKKSANTELKSRIGELTKLHQGGFWNSGRYRESTLWTLYALQEGVSRLANLEGEVGRGGGTVDLIKFFDELSGGRQNMCIVSGDAYILNDGSFRPSRDTNNNTVLAFNAENDLRQPPDPRFVYALDNPFPGTLISLRFPFNREHLEKLSLDEIAASDGGKVFRPMVVHVDAVKEA